MRERRLRNAIIAELNPRQPGNLTFRRPQHYSLVLYPLSLSDNDVVIARYHAILRKDTRHALGLPLQLLFSLMNRYANHCFVQRFPSERGLGRRPTDRVKHSLRSSRLFGLWSLENAESARGIQGAPEWPPFATWPYGKDEDLPLFHHVS